MSRNIMSRLRIKIFLKDEDTGAGEGTGDGILLADSLGLDPLRSSSISSKLSSAFRPRFVRVTR